MTKSIYVNLEDDIAKIGARLKKESADEVILVIPKKSQIFSDSINLRLLKKQADVLGKTVSIMTMDEIGQMYAKEAGLDLRFLPHTETAKGPSDIRRLVRDKSKPATSITRSSRVGATSTRTVPSRKTVERKTSPAIKAATVAITDTIFPQVDNAVQAVKNSMQLFPPSERTKSWGFKFNRFSIGFVIIAALLVLALVTLILPRADIIVYAKTQSVARDIDVTVSSSISSPELSRLSLPAKKVSKIVPIEKNISTEGKKDVGSKAAGTVKIFNFTGKSLNLKAATTTLTVGTRTYVFASDQNGIKATPTKESSPNNAQIVATGGGEPYNLPAGTRIEISNQVFGNQPQVLYAQTDTPIVGGSSRFISVVTDEDIIKAQNTLKTQATEELRSELKGQNIILPDDAFSITLNDFATSSSVGNETPNFSVSGKVNIEGLGFDTTELVNMMRQRILSTLGAQVNLQDTSLDTIEYTIKDLNIQQGIMHLTVHYESKAIGQVSVNDLSSSISGKSKEQASEILLANDQVERVDIQLAPSWQSSIPRFKQKINIELK